MDIKLENIHKSSYTWLSIVAQMLIASPGTQPPLMASMIFMSIMKILTDGDYIDDKDEDGDC